jgi:uncharacterized protein (TIRG00374 family)
LKRFLRVLIIGAVTIFLLVLFFRSSDPHNVMTLIRRMNPLWFVLSIVTNLVALLFRTARWRTLIDPESPPPFYPTLFATAVGFMSSAVLPVRAGDVVRPALLSRKTGMKFSSALGTVLIERVLDFLALLALFNWFVVSSLVTRAFPERRLAFIRTAGIVSFGLFFGMLTFLICVILFRDRIRVAHEWLGRFIPKRFRHGWMNFFESFTSTLELVRNRRAMVRVIPMTIGVWACLTGQFYFIAIAMGHYLPFSSSYFISGVSVIGLAIPTPGGIGGFHKACQLVLTNFYAFDVDASVALAVMFHIIGTLPVILAGIVMFIHEGLSIKQLAEMEHPPAEEDGNGAIETGD